MIEEKEFFKRWGDFNIQMIYYENDEYISVEELYGIFKARLERERLEEQSDD